MERTSSKLDRDRQTWDELAAMDPFWTVLTRKGHLDHWNEAEFFATGPPELAELMQVAEQNGLSQHGRRALDYGCGVGRMTRAMAPVFETCLGVDISLEMVSNARRLNAAWPNCSFEVIAGSGPLVYDSGTFDFVYSGRVLQHVTRPEICRILGELARVLAPQGLLVVQVPHRLPLRRRLQTRRHAATVLRALGVPTSELVRKLHLNPMRMTALPESEVLALLADRGLSVVEVVPQTFATTSIESRTYWATRR